MDKMAYTDSISIRTVNQSTKSTQVTFADGTIITVSADLPIQEAILAASEIMFERMIELSSWESQLESF